MADAVVADVVEVTSATSSGRSDDAAGARARRSSGSARRRRARRSRRAQEGRQLALLLRRNPEVWPTAASRPSSSYRPRISEPTVPSSLPGPPAHTTRRSSARASPLPCRRARRAGTAPPALAITPSAPCSHGWSSAGSSVAGVRSTARRSTSPGACGARAGAAEDNAWCCPRTWFSWSAPRLPQRERRARLEQLIDAPVDLTPASEDPAEAQPWLQHAEGVIAKRQEAPYRPGERAS